MVTISRAAYFASLRAVAPAISIASSPAATAALASLSPATEQDATAAPLLRAIAIVSREVTAVMEDDIKPLAGLDTFSEQPLPGIQRVLTHAVEKDVHASTPPPLQLPARTTSCAPSCTAATGGGSALLASLGSRERHRREPGRVPDAAEGAEEPDAQPDADGGGAWNECVT